MKPILIIAILLFIAGCYNEKKATQAVNKAAISYPEVLAKKARDLFPCVTSRGDTIYLSDSAAYHEALQQAADDGLELTQKNDSLQRELKRAIEGNDSSEIIEQYNNLLDEKETQINNLKYRLAHIPPIKITQTITDTVEDKAALKVCEADKNISIANLATQNKRADKFEGRSKKYFWIMLALSAIVGIGAYAKVKTFFKPKV